MRRLGVLFCVLCCALGCAADGDKGQWDEFWKDLHGDNMQMKYDSLGKTAGSDQPAPIKSRN